MKMRLLIIALLCLAACCIPARSQVNYSVELGPQLSPSLSWRAGVALDVPINHRYSIASGLYYVTRHRTESEKKNVSVGNPDTGDRDIFSMTTEYNTHGRYLQIPVGLGMNFDRANGDHYSLIIGCYLAYGIGGKTKVRTESRNTVKRTEYSSFGDGFIHPRFDYGLNVEYKYAFRGHFQLGAYTEIGFKRIYHSPSLSTEIISELFKINAINLTLGVSVGYRF